MTIHPARERFPEVRSGASVVFGAAAAASHTVENLTVSEHADRYRKVSEESGSPWPGDFRTDRVPYIREPQDCLHPDHPARRGTCRWAAQLGKSTILENWFCYIVDQAPGSMMITLPTLEEATKFNRIKLQPTIEATPRIRHKVVPVSSRDEQGSTTFFKRFAGGFCQIVNAGSSKGLQMVSIRYLAMDEVTGYPKDVDGRGSPRDQARARQKMYGDLAKEFQASTPGTAGECAISDDFDDGDQRFFYVACPHCRTYQPLTIDQMRGPSDGLPSHFRCQSCDGVMLDGHKADLLASGKWIATRVEDGEPGIPSTIAADEIARYECDPCEGRCRKWQPSWHLWAAYAPRERFGDIWKRWQDAQGDTTKLRTFMQQDLAEPYDPGASEVDHDELARQAKDRAYASREIPRWAAVVVSAADVQGYGIKWAVFALGPRGQFAIIDAEIFEGKPDQDDAPWIALADALGRKYACGSGDRGIDLSGVDSGFATQRVYRFCASRPNVFALDGRRDQSASWIGTPKRQQVKDASGRILATTLLYPVNAYDVKTEITAGMANFIAGPDAEGRWPRNVLHLTSEIVTADFAKELTAERLVDPEEEARQSVNRRARRLINPRAKREWKKVAGRVNDWFDVTVYARALGWHVETKKRLGKDDRWTVLLEEVHAAPAAPDLLDAVNADPFGRKPKRKKKINLAEIMAKMNGNK